MPDVVTDTRALIWYLEDSPRLGKSAREIEVVPCPLSFIWDADESV